MRFTRIIIVAVAVLAAVPGLRSQEMRQVYYDIDGTTKVVTVTWTKPGGSSEQKQLTLPVHESFRMPVGEMAYCAAQKTTVYGAPHLDGSREILADGARGTVHVVIQVNWRTVSEATSDAPHGIAKASAKVE